MINFISFLFLIDDMEERDEKNKLRYPRDTFKHFMEDCDNFQEIIQAEGITEENYPEFYEKLNYIYPEKRERFKLVKLEKDGGYVPLDSGIADIIVGLNSKGYRTRYCCEGHKHDHWHGGYIFFYDLDEQRTNSLLKTIYLISQEADRVYARAEVDDPRGITFRFRPKNKTPHQEILKILEMGFGTL